MTPQTIPASRPAQPLPRDLSSALADLLAAEGADDVAHAIAAHLCEGAQQ